SRYSSTVFEIRLRSRRSSFDKNSPSSRAFTILIAALVPSPSTTLNGGINALPSTRNSVASDLYKSTFLRSEEHTSELQSRFDLVCRLLLEKKKQYIVRHLM